MPVLHNFRRAAGRKLKACILIRWYERETVTRGFLVDLLASVGVNIQLHESISCAPFCHATQGRFNLSTAAMKTLSCGQMPSNTVVDCFLSLLEDQGTVLLKTSFLYHLLQRNRDETAAWPVFPSEGSGCVRKLLYLSRRRTHSVGVSQL